MIEGLAGLMLNLWVVVGLGLGLGVLVIGFTCSHLISIQSCFNASAKEKFLWAMALLPWISAISFVFLSLTPSITHALGWTSDHCHIHNHGHLCFHHPLVFEIFSWKMLFGLILMGVILISVLKILFRYHQQASSLGLLKSFSIKHQENVYIYENDQPHAFTAGIRSPGVFVSSSLINQLDHQELSIVLQHEKLHQQRRDPLRLGLFTLLISILNSSSRRQLSDAMELAIEKSVDAEVAKRNNPQTVAKTLVRVNRLELDYCKKIAIACAFGTTAIEERVQQLLSPSPGRQFPLLIFVICCSFLCFVSIYCANALHHLLENFLHHH